MSSHPNKKSSVTLEPLAFDIEDAARVSAMGLALIREAVDSHELASILKGRGTNRKHRIILREALLTWLRSLRDRQSTTDTVFPKAVAEGRKGKP